MANKRVVEVPGLPPGYRFLPSEDVLIRCYLINKNSSKPLPADVIADIQLSQLYTTPPYDLADQYKCMVENEWYFFVHGDEYYRGETKKEYFIGNEDGSWSSTGEEQPIVDSSGDEFAYKICYIYCPGPKSKAEKEWRFEKYRLPYECSAESKANEEEEGWVMARIIEDKGYVFPV